MNLFAPITAPSLSPLSSPSLTDPNGLGALSDPNGLGASAPAVPNDGTPSFGQTLVGALGHVNDLQNHAGDLTRAYALGQTSDIHGVMIAGEQATLALQLTTQIRNKVIDAYQEIMRISM